MHLGAGGRRVLDVADAEGDGHRVDRAVQTASASRRREPASRGRRDPAPAACRARRAASRRQNRRRPRAPRAASRVRAAIARSAVPVHRSSTRSSPGQLQRPDRRAPPAAIDAGAEQMVQQIVAPGDGVEHSGDARRTLGEISQGVGCLGAWVLTVLGCSCVLGAPSAWVLTVLRALDARMVGAFGARCS